MIVAELTRLHGFPITIAIAAARNGNGTDTAARNQTNLAGMNGISHKIMRWKANSAQATYAVVASRAAPWSRTPARVRSEILYRADQLMLDRTEELALLIRRGLWAKWSGHRINHPDFIQPERSMSMIGG